MFTTAGRTAFRVIQSIPASTVDVLPDPSFPRTLTATRETFVATPTREPPMVPATWVPCPFPSSAAIVLSTKFYP